MRDENVIRGLKCCTRGRCRDCPYRGMNDCAVRNGRDISHLLERKEREIDRLNQAHVLKIGEVQEHYRNQIGKARAEAIKEFAERLNEYIDFLTSSPYTEGVVPCIKAKIEQFMKEMTEGEDEN